MTSINSSRNSLRSNAALFFITFGLFGLYLIEFGVVGILPAITARYDISILQASWLLGSFALVVAVFGPVIVLFVGRFDRRLLLAVSLLVFSLCSLASAHAPSFEALLAIRIPGALLHAVFFSVAFATVRSLFPPQRSAQATAIAFIGTSLGMVLGVPLTAWIAATLSYESAFYLAAIANFAAAIGVCFMVSRSDSSKRETIGNTARVLKNPVLWLALTQAVFVFGAMLSVYGFAAEYLERVAGLDGQAVSVLLVIFGAGGVVGNILAGRLLARNLLLTALLYPVALSIAYVALLIFSSASFAVLFPVCLVWGAAHSAGMVVSQVWTISSAPEAPEFVTSLFVSAGNVGVLAGSTIGAAFITVNGMPGAVHSGWIFAAFAIALIAVSRTSLFRRPAKTAERLRIPA